MNRQVALTINPSSKRMKMWMLFLLFDGHNHYTEVQTVFPYHYLSFFYVFWNLYRLLSFTNLYIFKNLQNLFYLKIPKKKWTNHDTDIQFALRWKDCHCKQNNALYGYGKCIHACALCRWVFDLFFFLVQTN